MKKDDLLSAIGNIDDKFVQEAMEYKPAAGERSFDESVGSASKMHRRNLWLRWGSIAACLLISTGLWVGFGSEWTEPADSSVKPAAGEKKELPLLEVETATPAGCGQLVCIKKNGQLSDGNPWNENYQPETLPVYKNTLFGNTAGQPAPISRTLLEDKVKKTAKALGVKAEEIRYMQEEENGKAVENGLAYDAEIDNREVMIRASASNDIYIVFWDDSYMPKYNAVSAVEMTKENAEEIAAYLVDEFSGIIGFSNPKICVSKAYYGSEGGAPTWTLTAYEKGESQREDVLNYNLRSVTFELNEDGMLSRMWITDDLADREVYGEYPIIRLKKAKELLQEGNFITFCGHTEIPDIKNVERAELVYRSGNLLQTYMPYYAFTVRLQDKDNDLFLDENGEYLESYGVYYVPAVEAEYLENFSEKKGLEVDGEQDN